MRYIAEFFQNEESAKAFQKENNCGALYSAAKGSRTKSQYYVEAVMADMSDEDIKNRPYVIAWNEKSES